MSKPSIHDINRRLLECEEHIRELTKKVTQTDLDVVSVTTTLNSVLTTLGELKNSVEALKSRPSTLWDKAVFSVIGALASAFVTYIITGG